MADKLIDINDSIKNLPNLPGVYRFFDKNHELLYIGKAKNLKKRVQSYFSKDHDTFRLKLLVKKIISLEYTVVQSEQDALLLENNLIKEYQPRYNVLLKDDKTFPWICIKNEPFPRVFSTRNRIEDGSLYFGPYTSAHMVRTLLDMIRKLYPIRNCNFYLSSDNISSKKFSTCLEYQIENCKGPCEGLQSRADYDEMIENVKKIIKGNLSEVIQYLKELMNKFVGKYQFEEAQRVKEKLEILEKFQSKSTIVNPDIKDVDVFSIVSDDKYAIVNYLKIINGSIVQSHSLEITKKLDEKDEELIVLAMVDIFQKIPSFSKEVILPFKIGSVFADKKVLVPKIGDKKKLLDLSLRNAFHFKLERQKQKDKFKENTPQLRVVKQMQMDLKLNKPPIHIECFDNSNFQGTNPVSSCVVFKYGKPAKSEYRHYNIKTVVGPDDFASMQEVIGRRYSRLLKENQKLPDLIIVDGGKGQLSMAYKILQDLGIEKDIAIIGIAKRLEEIYFPNDSVPLYIDKNAISLKIIQRARNEAHRFGITHHRDQRSKDMIKSALDEIPGVGDKTKSLLLKKYKTVDKIKESGIIDLEMTIGKAKSKMVFDFFSKK